MKTELEIKKQKTNEINKLRGVEDVFGDYARKFIKVQKTIENTVNLYGFQEIKVPVIESIDVFVRSVGETSDIVKKEFYNFKDKGDREIALRPEITAGIARAAVENKLLEKEPLPLRVASFGPVFRYERPQSGRLRQFNQYDIEMLGTDSMYDDVECISLACKIFENIGIKNFKVYINNLGNFETRAKWIEELKVYLRPYYDQLSPISQERLEKNPLRILDDKVDGELPFVKNAPKISKYLNDKEKQEQKVIEDSLKKLNINYELDENLVRGLDYYTNLVFEFKVDDLPSIGGGGRYAKLLGEFGSKDYSSIGFAVSIERLLVICEKLNINLLEDYSLDAVVASFDEENNNLIPQILQTLRENNLSVIGKFDSNKAAKIFNYAEKMNAKFVVLIGKKELQENSVIVKNLSTTQQEVVKLTDVASYLTKSKN
ncbi:MAG: histidine--tRNA ligase [Mycoplasmataceae bacterium]|jgi:histidyl-tRNA synthetase|nr:histidine--tRNA ligase [Mycoplasmataceae bacterium]